MNDTIMMIIVMQHPERIERFLVDTMNGSRFKSKQRFFLLHVPLQKTVKLQFGFIESDPTNEKIFIAL